MVETDHSTLLQATNSHVTISDVVSVIPSTLYTVHTLRKYLRYIVVRANLLKGSCEKSNSV